jgi:enoyl-CoA hydratase/carnithine racemase
VSLDGDEFTWCRGCRCLFRPEAVPLGALDETLEALLAKIVANPREAIAAGKGLFYRQLEMGTEAAYQLAGQTMACNMMDTAALEGVQAFIDKRAPDWRGAR